MAYAKADKTAGYMWILFTETTHAFDPSENLKALLTLVSDRRAANNAAAESFRSSDVSPCECCE